MFDMLRLFCAPEYVARALKHKERRDIYLRNKITTFTEYISGIEACHTDTELLPSIVVLLY